MLWFSPLFARGRGTAKFFEGLYNGEPVAWGILGFVAIGFSIYGIVQYSKSQKNTPPSNIYNLTDTPRSESFCPRCGLRVKPLADGTCPNCKEHKFPVSSSNS